MYHQLIHKKTIRSDHKEKTIKKQLNDHKEK